MVGDLGAWFRGNRQGLRRKRSTNKSNRQMSVPQEYLTEADIALYWAMVNDELIARDLEIEKQYKEFLASSGE